MKLNKKLSIGALGAVCAVCCAVPIIGVLTGVVSLSAITAWFTADTLVEVLLCTVPFIALGAGYYFYRRRQAQCCDSPESNCSRNQCGVN